MRTTTRTRPTPNTQYFLVSTVRDGIRRTTTLPKTEARQTIHDAVSAGIEVSFRQMTDSDPLILGVKEEPVIRPTHDVAKMTATIQRTPEVIGNVVARRVFANRGNHSEAHLTETELAGWLKVAAEMALVGRS